MSAINILITRPVAQAVGTAAAVERLGGKAFILPLSEIVTLDFVLPALRGKARFDGLLASSANAFTTLKRTNMLEQFPKIGNRLFDKNCSKNKKLEQFVEPSETKYALERFYALPLFCVGEQTAEAARSVGFNRIAAIADDASSLGQLLENHQNRHFLYFAGRHRRLVLEAALTAQGKKITVLETYDQRPLAPDAHNLANLPTHLDYVLFYSNLAVRQFFYPAPHLQQFTSDATRFLCLSRRIAASLPPPYARQNRSPQRPQEAALLELLGNDIKQRL